MRYPRAYPKPLIARSIRWRTLSIIIGALILGAAQIYAQGIITTIAGNGGRGFSGDGIPATSALLSLGNFTGGVAVDVVLPAGISSGTHTLVVARHGVQGNAVTISIRAPIKPEISSAQAEPNRDGPVCNIFFFCETIVFVTGGGTSVRRRQSRSGLGEVEH